MVYVLTWHGWSWGVSALTLHGWIWGGLSGDLTWMEVGWSVCRPGMDGGGVVCFLTWHGWIWGGANLCVPK